MLPKKEEAAGCCVGWVPKKEVVAAGCGGAVEVLANNPPDGAGVVVAVEKEKAAGAVVLGAKRPPDGAALEVELMFKLRPPNGDGVVLGFCDVDGSNIDFRLPYASVVGFKFGPPKGLLDVEASGPDDGGPKSDILSR